MRGGSETDVDCGGAACPPCGDGQACAADGDCVSDRCGADGTCAAAACGDGTQNGAEECDAGSGGAPAESPTCDADCTAASCGDGTHNAAAGEACDGGGAQTASCELGCTLARCGDGIVNALAGETCDGDGAGAGGETDACDDDCTAPSCGDGVTNEAAGEACDDGNTVDDDACSNACELRVGSLTVSSDATFDTDRGELDGAARPGWDGSVLAVDDLTIPAGVRLLVRGSQPLRVVALGDATVAGVVDVPDRTAATRRGAP
ncbi:MAG: hypothetical protein M5U28_53485 [Sandaracinaceae bacterium]|nr:hypothetical protein [Sandaracinaceae bacterium]